MSTSDYASYKACKATHLLTRRKRAAALCFHSASASATALQAAATSSASSGSELKTQNPAGAALASAPPPAVWSYVVVERTGLESLQSRCRTPEALYSTRMQWEASCCGMPHKMIVDLGVGVETR